MKKTTKLILFLCAVLSLPAAGFAGTLFQENFEDGNFSQRGWYDTTSGVLSTTEHIPGSRASLECRFSNGATDCTGKTPTRHKFTATNSVYVSYWVKHSSNWAGSGTSYHPHMIYLLTNLNGDYQGLSYDHLTAYIEENQGYPVLGIQDGQNIDESRIGQNLIGVTENRAVGGCNGTQPSIGQDFVNCYAAGSVHWNGIIWKGPSAVFFDPAQKTSWHFVEAYFELNTISNGIGQPDGIVQYWYDGALVIDHQNVIIRTGANASMLFNQFVLAPYIGDGSPVDQTYWMDDLTVATARPSVGTKPSAPRNLRVQ